MLFYHEAVDGLEVKPEYVVMLMGQFIWSLRKIRLQGPPLPEHDSGMKIKLGLVGVLVLVVLVLGLSASGCVIMPWRPGGVSYGCSWSSFPAPVDGVRGVLARGSRFHWFQSRSALTAATIYRRIEASHEAEEWTSAYLPGLYPPRESPRTIHPQACRSPPPAGPTRHTHTSALMARLVPAVWPDAVAACFGAQRRPPPSGAACSVASLSARARSASMRR